MSLQLDRLADYGTLYGFPLYIYDSSSILRQLHNLTALFPEATVLYSMKTNPHPEICKCIIDNNAGIDAASGNEVLQAYSYGLTKEHILYSAPGKTDDEIVLSIDKCTIIADSYTELQRIDALCGQAGLRASVGLRISPNFSYGAGVCPSIAGGLPDKFGEAEEDIYKNLPMLTGLQHVSLSGFHVYVRSQILSATALSCYFAHIFALAHTWVHVLRLDLKFINFGGGFGISYCDDMQPFDHLHLKNAIADLQKNFSESFLRPVRFYVESGRYLVAKSGIFVTKIVDIKYSRGKIFVIAPGLMNAFLRPAIAGLIANIPHSASIVGPMEPLWSGHKTYFPKIYGKPMPQQLVTVCGNLCTSMDTICRDILLENVAIGNLLTLENAGAYAATLSPHEFAGHGKPAEIVL